MNYPDGTEVEIGDIVEFLPDIKGKVMCMPSAGQFTATYSKEEWGQTDGDIMIETDNGAHILLKLNYPHLKFIEKPKLPK